MAQSPSLQLTQKQSLVMTPQLQQSIKLLQMTTADLAVYVEEQLIENPLLMASDQENEVVDQEKERDDAEFSSTDDNSEIADTFERAEAQGFNEDASLDVEDTTNWQEQATAGSSEEAGYWDIGQGGGSIPEGNILEQTVAEAPSLQDHLRDQVMVDMADPAQRMIALYLIDLVEPSGYLPDDGEAMLMDAADMLGCSPDEVEAVIHLLQQCDPAGICARSLRECLTLQCRERGLLDEVMAEVLASLELLGQGEFKKVARHCGVSEAEICDKLAQIRELNPKPGLQFAQEVVQEARPDVMVAPDGKKGWKIELTYDQLPKLLVNRQYYTHVSEHACDKDDKHYLTDRLSQANWLVKALDQRATTILNVAKEIVSCQGMFFKYGVQYMKPLTLREVAEKIGVHESTVSRVTTGKYMMTPRGLFELKYFFTSGVQSSDGAVDISSEAVKAQIKKLIDDEPPKKILSDDKIAIILQEQGIDVARRTVAKYREAMGIGSSVERRRQKKMAL